MMKIQLSVPLLFAALLCSTSALSQTSSHTTVEMSFAFFDVTTGKAVLPNQFSLKSTEDERKEMNIVNRDMSPKEMNRIARETKNFKEIVDALDRGEIRKEDLPQDALEKLKAMLL